MIVIRANEHPDNSTFYTPNESGIQLGFIVNKKGYKSQSHKHKKDGNEIVIATKGKCRINFSDRNVEMDIGDIIIFDATEKHNIEMLEDFKGIIIKQGPYISKGEDKIIYEK